MASQVSSSISEACAPPSSSIHDSLSPVQGIASRSPTSGEDGSQSAEDEPETDRSVDSHQELSADDDVSDFEETLKKKPKTTRRRSVKQTQATRRGLRHDRVGEELFEAIVRGRSAKQIIVDDWLDSYKTDREPALLGLLNFIIKACGCKGVVTRDMMATMQNAEIIRKMTEDFDEDSADYPLSLSTKTWKKFRVNFGEFLGALVICCQHNVIYDGIFMDLLVSFVTGLSDSQVRAFRHTSTFAAMKLMTALVKVARDLSRHLETSQRQFNVERAKSPEKRSAERLEALEEKMAEMYSSLEDIGNMMNGIFKGVFVHRYRDVHPDIRALCIEELGTWITNYPQNFLNDSYLKYLGWMLHDKGLVRLQCLQSLHGVYNVPQWTGKLELFTSRFKSRIVAMALDKEPQVSAEAIHLIILISKCMENILSREDCESVHPLVYTTNRAVAVAAGEFLYQRILDTSAEEPSPEHSHRRSAHTAFFHLLIEFFISSELHDHAAYLVDSLWDSAAPQLRDWECQTDLLLMKKTCLDDQEESALIKILASSIRQAAEGTAPIGRGPMRKILSAKDKKTHSEDRLRLSRHMILTLPHLLAKFSADEDKMRALLKVVQYLELEIFSTERLEKNLDLLLTQVQDILEKHTEPQVLEACSRTLYILCDPDLAFSKRTDIVLSQLVDRLTAHFHNHLSDILQVMDLDEDDMYNTAATMKRLSALYSAHDLTRWELFDPCCHILEKAIDTSEVPEQIVVPALVCGHFSLLWELSHYSMVQPSEDSLDTLQKSLVLFVTLCQSLLSDVHCSVREQTFILLSDLLVVFNDHVGHGERSYLQTLSYSAEVPLQAELAGFLVDHVFTNSEDEDGEDEGSKIHRLHKRRVLLAGYCKMVLHNALELRFASEIFKYYIKYYTEYGDIIKETLHRIRRISKEESTRTILLCLTQAYTGFSLEDDSTDRRFSPAFMEIRDLARRFALLLGPDQIRNRQDIVLLHKEGIQFCLQAAPGVRWSPQNLLFLDVLSEFSPKLLTQDKAVLLHYLEEMCQQCVPSVMAPGAPKEGDDMWALLSAYKRSLGTDPESRPATPSTRRAKERRQAHSPLSKKRRFEKDDSSSSLADENGLMPLMSSTMLRSGAKATESPTDDRGGSDSDFDTSKPFTVRRPLTLPPRTRRETPSALPSSLHRLSLMEEEEEDDDEEMVIDDRESSATSTEEERLDLLDSAILDSEDLHYLEEMCQQYVPSVMVPGVPKKSDDMWALQSTYKRSLGTDPESRPATPSTRRAKERRQAHSPLSKKRRFEKDDSSSSLADENGLMPLMSSTMLRSGAKATESPTDDRGGSDSDFDTSQPFTVRRPLTLPPRTRRETPSALPSSLHRLHYLEEMCQQYVPSVMVPGVPKKSDDMWALQSTYKRSLGTDQESRAATPSTHRAKERRQAHSPLSKKRRFEKDDSSSSLADENGLMPLMSSTMLRSGAKATESPTDDRGGSDSDFDTSKPFTVRRPLTLPPRTRRETPSALPSSLHRLSLMEEEEEDDDDDDEEMVIDDRESSTTSTEEERLDLLDSAILDSEE
ncbi:cohesin subunit SA-3 isoform X2 [Ranitomeya variabilis]|uniref:cohesin subunit SA-3 isoform X2 n=1 Tax=Ranitomeya variabilis TaxID=490064 RepID=UPI004056FC86